MYAPTKTNGRRHIRVQNIKLRTMNGFVNVPTEVYRHSAVDVHNRYMIATG